MNPRPTRGVVFVADDDDVVRTSVEELLEDEGYLVLGARDGHEALARMRGINGPAVAIVDLGMPRLDGRALIDCMRADPELARIPVLVLSGGEPCLVQGANRFLRKPYLPHALLQAVAELFA